MLSRGWFFLIIFGLCLLIYGLHRAHAEAISQVVGGISSTPTRLSPAAAFWNPAVFGAAKGTQMETNLILVGGWLIFDRDGVNPVTGNHYTSALTSTVIGNPFFSIVSDFGMEKFRFGYSTFFPAGGIANFDERGAQRYDLISGKILPWHHQLTVTYNVFPHLSLAASGIVSFEFIDATLDIDIAPFISQVSPVFSNSAEDPSMSSRAEVPLSVARGYGFSLGLLYTPHFQWSFGLSFYSPMSYHYETELKLKRPVATDPIAPALEAVGLADKTSSQIRIQSDLPAFVQGGLMYQPFGYWSMEFFGRYTFASLSSPLIIHFKKSSVAILQDLHLTGKDSRDTFVLGSAQTLSFWQKWAVGLSGIFSTNGYDDNQLSITSSDFSSFLIGPFIRHQWSKHILFSAEYSHTFMFERQAKGTFSWNYNNTSTAMHSASRDGLYRAAIDRLGIGVRYAF